MFKICKKKKVQIIKIYNEIHTTNESENQMNKSYFDFVYSNYCTFSSLCYFCLFLSLSPFYLTSVAL